MEIQIPYTILFAFLCFLLAIYRLSNSKKSLKTLPPGPWKLPLIGNLHQIGTLPHRSLRDLAKKYGPMMHLQLGELSHVIVSSPELAKEILKTHDIIFANRARILASDTFLYNSQDIAFSPYGTYWRQLRKICILEILSVKRVQTFRKVREGETAALVKNISEHEGSAINLSKGIFSLTNSVVARAALGKKFNTDNCLSTIGHVLRLIGGFTISDFYPSLETFLLLITGMKAKFQKVQKESDMMMEDIIRDHKEKKGSHVGEAEEDLVDVLLRIQKENDLEIPLTLENIKAVIVDVLFAATETSATTMEWTMSELLRNPEIMKKAQVEVRRVYGGKGYVDESQLHELKYVGAVIKETFRLRPPAALVPRENTESCEINGYEIPRKTKVIINAWAIAHDPKYWNEPEKFQPERFLDTSDDYSFQGTNFAFLPFGSGRRMCPGVAFASAVIELVIANLLYHFDWKLANGIKHNDLDMSESFGATVKRKNDLLVVPICYQP